MRTLTIAAAVLLAACSASRNVAKDATVVSNAAQTVIDSADAINAEAKGIEERSTQNAEIASNPDPDLARVVENSSRNASAARSIQSETDKASGAAKGAKAAADDIHKNLTGVKDIVPWWASLIGIVCISAAVLAVVFVLWRSNALSFLGAWATWVTPKKRAAASLAAKSLDPAFPNTLEELVAYLRATDPAFNKAFPPEQTKLAVRKADVKTISQETNNADAG